MQQRRRTKQVQSLEARLTEEARRLREQASLLAPGVLRDTLLRKARQCETGAHVSEWLSSSGLQSPR
jgi:hypothetical protein